MKNKSLYLLGASVLSLMILVSLVSATITISEPSALSQTSGSFNLTISSDQNETIDFSIEDITQGSHSITFTAPTPITINDIDSQEVEVSYVIDSGFDFELSVEYSTDFIASGSESDNVTRELNFKVDDNYCSLGNQGGDLELDVEINNVKGFGQEDDEWYAFDEIEVEIEVENDGNDDIDDIIIEWGLYNPETGDWVIDEEEDDFNLKDGKSETITIDFKVDVDDLDADVEDYIFYVKAYSDDLGEDSECVSSSDNIDVKIEDDFVILDDIQFTETVSCGTELQISADVWNIGEDDQEDVYVIIYNQELGINEQIEIGDVDSFEDEKLELTVEIPENTEEKTYHLTFWVYDEDNDRYENDEDDDSEFYLPLKIEGNCYAGPQVTVSADLESGGKAGQELVVKAVITNIGTKLATYNLNMAGYADWASSTMNQQTIILGSAESKEVLITLNVNKNVEGEKTFDIEVLSENELLVLQPVSINVEKAGFNFNFLTGNAITTDNKYLWGIGILNIILVIVIIIVAIKVAKN
jgi:hypothetical protein